MRQGECYLFILPIGFHTLLEIFFPKSSRSCKILAIQDLAKFHQGSQWIRIGPYQRLLQQWILFVIDLVLLMCCSCNKYVIDLNCFWSDFRLFPPKSKPIPWSNIQTPKSILNIIKMFLNVLKIQTLLHEIVLLFKRLNLKRFLTTSSRVQTLLLKIVWKVRHFVLTV